MHYSLKLSKNRLHIFQEGPKRRVFVGELSYDETEDRYILEYDAKFPYSKRATSLGPQLSFFQLKHVSEKGKMFPYFLDRIPDPENPAYPDYCASQGISVNEKNLIVLLGSIGRRGPSCFIFEAIYETSIDINQIIEWRKNMGLTQHDFALAFDLSQATLQRLEDGKSIDCNSLKRLEMLFYFPDVALWQLRQTGERIHGQALARAVKFLQHAI